MKKSDFFIAILLALLLCGVATLFYGLSQKAVSFAQQDAAPAYTQAIINFNADEWKG